MTDKINELLRRVEEFKPKAAAEIEEFRIRILGKKGELTALMEEFKTVAPELKRELGHGRNRDGSLVIIIAKQTIVCTCMISSTEFLTDSTQILHLQKAG